MSTRKFTILLFIASSVLFGFIAGAQTPWSGTYGNDWLDGKYGQSWLRIGVSKSGVFKVALPANFQNKPTLLHLYHRGVEVSLVSASNTEIEFYGVANDGASDAWLYRFPTTRKNPYFSLYSDESAYFLTFDSTPRTATVSENLAPDGGVPLQESHKFTYFKEFTIEYSHMTSYPSRPTTMNAYFEEGKQGTGTRLPNNNTIKYVNPKPAIFTNSYPAAGEDFTFQIKSKFGTDAPQLNVHLKGRGYQFSANSTVEIFAGKSKADASMRSLGTTNVIGYLDADFPTASLQDGDVLNGVGYLGIKNTGGATDGISVSYYSVTYDQNIDMQGLNSYEFNFPASSANTRIAIQNQPAGTLKFLDVSDADHPRIINGTAGNLMFSRNGNSMKMLVTNESTTVAATAVSFQDLNPAQYDYLIITNETLAGSAATYATYRQTQSPGKKYKPLVIKIKDIYNQFNYGEPSPVAIRRFVDLMVSDGNTDKYLLLLGKSITYYERTTREMPDEVPTVGFPGSDILLTDGLGGAPDDVPVIPVGRISAISDQQVVDYLDKIKTYEEQKDLDWRKNVLHINGGKAPGEVGQFYNYLSSISGPIINAPFSGDTINRPKTQEVNSTITTTIAPWLTGTAPAPYTNVQGVGMVTYFGHGNVDNTDYDFGYATDPGKAYTNNGKYPVLFYNGCGVNNIFSNRFNPFTGTVPGSSGKRPLSLDWLLAPKGGAIVVFGNDWDAYASTSNEYLDRLYPKIFGEKDADRGTIGQILKEVALETKTTKGYNYNLGDNARIAAVYQADRANVHQVILQGDPALRILINEDPLPVSLVSFDAKAIDNSRIQLTWETASERNNSHFVIERSYNAKNFEVIGQVEGKGDSDALSSYAFIDASPLAGVNYYRLKQVDRTVVENGNVIEGKATFSRIVSVTREGTSALVVSPNPATDWINIQVNIPVGIKSWDILDQKGNTYQKDRKGNKVNVQGLTSGGYILKIVTENDDVYLKKIFKK
ncbi:Por secretion system C-terminal sorting domain-containing protein [Dyadobacter sp. SG02]|uniref:putative type IX secretion system sortase PorU2 n=1 Tax=Dyadobacter sp. SG02 TaxID=1855291 RepID=UPI0008D89D00|nr:C25 family cysteine peptidase [Dyadobacter sp. SG02]SEJ31801.1 Por secretion system C-terminal sorting domain-containing protein [Dyadobacter sp. SG02]